LACFGVLGAEEIPVDIDYLALSVKLQFNFS